MRTLRRPAPRFAAVSEPALVKFDYVEVTVIGRPAPQGSKQFFKNGGSKESSRFLEPWRNDVTAACTRVKDDGELEQITGPVRCECVFTLDGPPKNDKDRPHPIYPPDVDKLLRSTYDAITASELWKDDAQVIAVGNSRKVYNRGADPDRLVGTTGVVIRIWRL